MEWIQKLGIGGRKEEEKNQAPPHDMEEGEEEVYEEDVVPNIVQEERRPGCFIRCLFRCCAGSSSVPEFAERPKSERREQMAVEAASSRQQSFRGTPSRSAMNADGRRGSGSVAGSGRPASIAESVRRGRSAAYLMSVNGVGPPRRASQRTMSIRNGMVGLKIDAGRAGSVTGLRSSLDQFRSTEVGRSPASIASPNGVRADVTRVRDERLKRMMDARGWITRDSDSVTNQTRGGMVYDSAHGRREVLNSPGQARELGINLWSWGGGGARAESASKGRNRMDTVY